MKTPALVLSLLMLACAPAMAYQAPQSATSTHSAAERAALQQELAQLQQRMDQLAKRMGNLSSQLALDTPHAMVFRYLADANRGLLGVVLKPDRKAQGYEVVALTPDGSAQQAGVQVGDVITHVDGKPVKIDLQPFNVWPLGGFKAGVTVKLGIRRGDKPMTLSLKARRSDTAAWPNAVMASTLSSLPDSASIARASSAATKALRLTLGSLHAQRLATATVSGMPLAMAFSPWWGLNLAPMNADLARYFGTRNGALVLSTQPKRYAGLKAGDVITSVNGKAVHKPEDVMRALRGQLQGMTVQLGVRRHGKALVVGMPVPSASTQAPPALDLPVTQ